MTGSFVVSSMLWFLTCLCIATMGFWLVELFLGWFRYEPPEIEHPPSEVQVRILTIGTDPALVQQTVDALPTEVADIHVITEQQITINGAVVDVVPDSFQCVAEKKGRALEWARRAVSCDREYILYLDEDSQAIDFEGVPDADIVQFGEQPFRTGSRLSYWVDVFRMGFQIEMRAFSTFDVPLYAWGGGIAVRQELEEKVTWNFESIVEDTSFVWRSAEEFDIDFAYVNTKFRNQAPPSLWALIRQRRRWYAGSMDDLGVLPLKYYCLAGLRNVSWVLVAVVPVLWVVSWLSVSGSLVPFGVYFHLASLVTTAFLFAWSIIGSFYMNESLRLTAVITVLAPVLSILNGLGAVYGAVSPPDDFAVTEKTSDETVMEGIEAD